MKILEKKGDNLGVGNIDNIAAFATCEPEQVVILQLVNDF